MLARAHRIARVAHDDSPTQLNPPRGNFPGCGELSFQGNFGRDDSRGPVFGSSAPSYAWISSRFAASASRIASRASPGEHTTAT